MRCVSELDIRYRGRRWTRPVPSQIIPDPKQVAERLELRHVPSDARMTRTKREQTVSPNEHRRLRHARIKEVLFEVSALEGGARAAFLDEACALDPELRAEVESLLSYHDARLDVERRGSARPGPVRAPLLGATASVPEAELSTPTDYAGSKAARRPRRKSSR